MPSCDKTKCEVASRISRWPQVLVLTLKRCQWDARQNRTVNTTAIAVPPTLDELTPGYQLVGTLVRYHMINTRFRSE